LESLEPFSGQALDGGWKSLCDALSALLQEKLVLLLDENKHVSLLVYFFLVDTII
jgi:hypothetical protein